MATKKQKKNKADYTAEAEANDKTAFARKEKTQEETKKAAATATNEVKQAAPVKQEEKPVESAVEPPKEEIKFNADG